MLAVSVRDGARLRMVRGGLEGPPLKLFLRFLLAEEPGSFPPTVVVYHHCGGKHRCMYSAIEHFARICVASDWKAVNMVMLTAAFDCSQDKEEKYFIMAGFASSAERWSDFDIEWRKRLARDGLPYFHMQPFAQSFDHPKKPFDKSWVGNEPRRRALLADLLDITQHHAWRKFGCILPVDSWQIFSDVARQNFLPSMIATTGRLIWNDVELWRRRENFRHPARMVFEHGDANRGTLIKAMEEITGRVPDFEFKKDDPEKGRVAFTPLQASDILAYEIQKQTQDLNRPVDEVTLRFPYTQLEKILGDVKMLKAEGTKQLDQALKVQQYFNENPLGGGTAQ